MTPCLQERRLEIDHVGKRRLQPARRGENFRNLVHSSERDLAQRLHCSEANLAAIPARESPADREGSSRCRRHIQQMARVTDPFESLEVKVPGGRACTRCLRCAGSAEATREMCRIEARAPRSFCRARCRNMSFARPMPSAHGERWLFDNFRRAPLRYSAMIPRVPDVVSDHRGSHAGTG